VDLGRGFSLGDVKAQRDQCRVEEGMSVG